MIEFYGEGYNSYLSFTGCLIKSVEIYKRIKIELSNIHQELGSC